MILDKIEDNTEAVADAPVLKTKTVGAEAPPVLQKPSQANEVTIKQEAEITTIVSQDDNKSGLPLAPIKSKQQPTSAFGTADAAIKETEIKLLDKSSQANEVTREIIEIFQTFQKPSKTDEVINQDCTSSKTFCQDNKTTLASPEIVLPLDSTRNKNIKPYQEKASVFAFMTSIEDFSASVCADTNKPSPTPQGSGTADAAISETPAKYGTTTQNAAELTQTTKDGVSGPKFITAHNIAGKVVRVRIGNTVNRISSTQSINKKKSLEEMSASEISNLFDATFSK